MLGMPSSARPSTGSLIHYNAAQIIMAEMRTVVSGSDCISRARLPGPMEARSSRDPTRQKLCFPYGCLVAISVDSLCYARFAEATATGDVAETYLAGAAVTRRVPPDDEHRYSGRGQLPGWFAIKLTVVPLAGDSHVGARRSRATKTVTSSSPRE
jgi:hypothetical protein